MKRNRSDKKEWGSGSGGHIFESHLFNVVLWKMDGGFRTTLNILACNREIHFDGKVSIKSDKACFEQLSVTEIKKIIYDCEQVAFKRGRANKAAELRRCLNE